MIDNPPNLNTVYMVLLCYLLNPLHLGFPSLLIHLICGKSFCNQKRRDEFVIPVLLKTKWGDLVGKTELGNCVNLC